MRVVCLITDTIAGKKLILIFVKIGICIETRTIFITSENIGLTQHKKKSRQLKLLSVPVVGIE